MSKRKLSSQSKTDRVELPICYVCEKVIKDEAVYIGKNLCRHKNQCAPFTENWKRFKEKQKNANLICN